MIKSNKNLFNIKNSCYDKGRISIRFSHVYYSRLIKYKKEHIFLVLIIPGRE